MSISADLDSSSNQILGHWFAATQYGRDRGEMGGVGGWLSKSNSTRIASRAQTNADSPLRPHRGVIVRVGTPQSVFRIHFGILMWVIQRPFLEED